MKSFQDQKEAHEYLKMIEKAIELQMRDPSLWFNPTNVRESYLQDSIRDLHRIITWGDVLAYNRVIGRG